MSQVNKESVLWSKKNTSTLNSNENSQERYLIQRFMSDIEIQNEIKAKFDALMSLEILKSDILKEYYNLKQSWQNRILLSEQSDNSAQFLNMISVEEVKYNGADILKIKLNYLLPHYTKTMNNKMAYYDQLDAVYKIPLIEELLSSNLSINFAKEKVHILITQYTKDERIFDLDNRFHSFLFNSLRSARIIEDDSWRYISYTENGEKSDSSEDYTLILVSKKEHISLLFELIEHRYFE